MAFNQNDVTIALYDAWDSFREIAAELPEASITIGAGNGPTVYRDDELAQVFISQQTLSHGPTATLAALGHDAVHVLAEKRGVVDNSDRGRYHSRVFIILAATLGFDFDESDQPARYGTAAIRPLPSNYQVVLKSLADLLPPDRDGAPIPMCRAQRVVRTGGNNLKAVCQCNPVRIIRVSRSTLRSGAIMCAKCNHRFTLQEV